MLGIVTDDLRIPGEVAAVLRYYVYALRDPRNGRVFYIGKGIGDRINAHTRDAGKDPESERAKLRTILDIEATGHPVELLFLRTDIEDETTAFIVEQAVIDAFHADGQPLTNLVRGHGLRRPWTRRPPRHHRPPPRRPMPAHQPAAHHGQDPERLAPRLQPGSDLRPDPRPLEISGWVRDRAHYCLGVAPGIVRGAYRIDTCLPSEVPTDQGQNRWGFTGHGAPELAHVIGTQVRDVFGGRVMYRRYLKGYPGAEPDQPPNEHA